MSDEERLLAMQQLVAITQLLQSFYNVPVSATYLMHDGPFHPDQHFQRMLKEYQELYAKVWP